MTKNKWLLVSVLSVVSGVGGLAAAQPGGSGRFEKLDTNGDGVVTSAEMQTGLLERWTKADSNQDGKVTAEEMKAQFAAHKQERFGKRDSNGNGVLERTEVEKMPADVFTKLDADKSGTLSPAELASGHFEHGGKGPGGEHKGLPGDADNDGSVTKAEAVAGAQKLVAHMDKNGDGSLTKDELGHGRGGHGCHHDGAQHPAK